MAETTSGHATARTDDATTDPLRTAHMRDVALIKELGLRLFGYEHGEWINIGTVDAPRHYETTWARVTVEVCQLPAKFWRFTIEPVRVEDVHPVVLSTGSGSLSQYWPTVELFAGGMLRAEPVAS